MLSLNHQLLHRANTITGKIISEKKYTTKEAIRLSDKQKIQIKVRDVVIFFGERSFSSLYQTFT